VRPAHAPLSSSRTWLLTGATGFLGAYVLAALLRETADDVVCIVRGEDDERALARLLATALRYETGVEASPRVRVAAGDIESPRLGLSNDDYAGLCGEIGRVAHCAAAVDWAHRYDALRAANVVGTIELLRFASVGSRKAFHFVSSISACYSTRGGKRIRETDAAADPPGIHLGYAQTKWVGEALVREAGARGLPIAIYRPDLVAGHGITGVANTDDFLARLVKGCIELGLAPDIAWRVDACPVDFVAQAIVRLAGADAPNVAHLVNARSGRWMEAVLWMNLQGYRLRAVPYREWARAVEERACDASHPLHALRGFLLRKVPEDGGRYLPELYAEPYVEKIDDSTTRGRLGALDVQCPKLTPGLLDTWFEGYARGGFIPRANQRRCARVDESELRAGLERLLRMHFADGKLGVTGLRAFDLSDDSSILGALAAWHSGTDLALRGYAVETSRGCVEVVLKPRPDDAALHDVATAVARLCNPRLGAAFEKHWHRTPFAGTATREAAIHRLPVLKDDAPSSYGTVEIAGARALVLERVRGVQLADASTAPERWRGEDVTAVLEGIARIHAARYRREPALRGEAWLGPVLDAAAMRETAELWTELTEHARPFVAGWVGPAAGRSLRKLAASAPERAEALERLPRTLVHNDFNPRNVGVRATAGRRSMFAFDWELATLDVPQRDGAELLCFVLAPDTPADVLLHYVETHRTALERAAGVGIDAGEWLAGYALALADFGVQRLTMYALAQRLRARDFVPRIARTWAHLHETLHAVRPGSIGV
jgi:thioester reductase-like protein